MVKSISACKNWLKHHIPEGPQYIEKYYFTPGDSPYIVFESKYGREDAVDGSGHIEFYGRSFVSDH